jgi:hypothetical protein
MQVRFERANIGISRDDSLLHFSNGGWIVAEGGDYPFSRLRERWDSVKQTI